MPFCETRSFCHWWRYRICFRLTRIIKRYNFYWKCCPLIVFLLILLFWAGKISRVSPPRTEQWACVCCSFVRYELPAVSPCVSCCSQLSPDILSRLARVVYSVHYRASLVRYRGGSRSVLSFIHIFTTKVSFFLLPSLALLHLDCIILYISTTVPLFSRCSASAAISLLPVALSSRSVGDQCSVCESCDCHTVHLRDVLPHRSRQGVLFLVAMLMTSMFIMIPGPLCCGLCLRAVRFWRQSEWLRILVSIVRFQTHDDSLQCTKMVLDLGLSTRASAEGTIMLLGCAGSVGYCLVVAMLRFQNLAKRNRTCRTSGVYRSLRTMCTCRPPSFRSKWIAVYRF